MGTQVDHWLNSEAHALLRLSNSLVVLVMWNVWCAVEELVDAVADVCLHDVALLGLGVLVDDSSEVAEEDAWLDQLNGLVQALPGCLDNADGVWVVLGLLADVVGFVQVAVEAFVVESNVNVQDIAVNKDALIWDTVADTLVEGCADGLWEVAVVQWRWV